MLVGLRKGTMSIGLAVWDFKGAVASAETRFGFGVLCYNFAEDMRRRLFQIALAAAFFWDAWPPLPPERAAWAETETADDEPGDRGPSPADKSPGPFISARDRLSPEADGLVFEGLEALYRLDFDLADAKFKDIDRLHPEHPAGPFYLAGRYWLEFSQSADLPGTAATLEPDFNASIDRALARARTMYRADKDDPEANYYLGVVYGMRGRWQLFKRQWLRAAANGYKGYKFLRRTAAVAPDYYDAFLGLGMYEYYSDTLPRIIKLGAFLFTRGDKQRGLDYVRLAIEKGRYNVVEAQLFLVALYTGYEHTPEKAFPIIRALRSRWPENPLFAQLEVVARVDARDWSGAIAFGEMLAPKVRQLPYTRPHVSVFDLYLGEAYMGGKDYDTALTVFDRCIDESPEPRKATVTYCHLRRAQVHDLLGLRGQALKDYRIVRQREDFFDSQDKAKLGLKNPATYEMVLKQFRE